jgi:hypothetical protein
MVPSGDIVDRAERDKRMQAVKRPAPANEIFGMSWDELERKQGGKLNRKPST